jgi:hypothetical protein
VAGLPAPPPRPQCCNGGVDDRRWRRATWRPSSLKPSNSAHPLPSCCPNSAWRLPIGNKCQYSKCFAKTTSCSATSWHPRAPGLEGGQTRGRRAPFGGRRAVERRALWLQRHWPGADRRADEVTLSRKGAKSRTQSRKLRSGGTNARTRVPCERVSQAELEQKLKTRTRELAEARTQLAEARPGVLRFWADRIDIFRRAAGYVDRILRGEKPGELPFQTADETSIRAQPQGRERTRPGSAGHAAPHSGSCGLNPPTLCAWQNDDAGGRVGFSCFQSRGLPALG